MNNHLQINKIFSHRRIVVNCKLKYQKMLFNEINAQCEWHHNILPSNNNYWIQPKHDFNLLSDMIFHRFLVLSVGLPTMKYTFSLIQMWSWCKLNWLFLYSIWCYWHGAWRPKYNKFCSFILYVIFKIIHHQHDVEIEKELNLLFIGRYTQKHTTTTNLLILNEIRLIQLRVFYDRIVKDFECVT